MIINPQPAATPTASTPAWRGFLDIAGDGTPTATELENTLGGSMTWAKFQTGILRGTPAIGIMPNRDKVWIDCMELVSTSIGDNRLNMAQIEVVNSPRVIQVTTYSVIVGVTAIVNLPTARIYIEFYIYP
jgi:hypothetical protein